MKKSKIPLIFIVVFLIFNFIIPAKLFSQNSTTDFKKNAIKGMFGVLPPFQMYFIGGSLGYERYLTENHSLELISAYIIHGDEMGYNTKVFSLKPGYNYYFTKKRKYVRCRNPFRHEN